MFGMRRVHGGDHLGQVFVLGAPARLVVANIGGQQILDGGRQGSG